MANNTYGIFENAVFMEEMVFNEAYRSPLRKKLEQLKAIKDASPKEYDGPKEVKDYVDKHYDEIVKCANILEKEGKDLEKDSIRYLCSACSMLIASMTGLLIPSIGGIAVIGVILGFIWYIVETIALSVRMSKDEKAAQELQKIRIALRKVKDNKKIDDKSKKKIVDMIDAIDNAGVAEQ